MSWQEVQREVQQLAVRQQRPVTIVAVTKGQTLQKLTAALAMPNPPQIFGESYLQEAREKQKHLSAAQVEWHFIGRLQSRKLNEVAENFSCLHSVGRMKEVAALAAINKPGPRFFLQINTSQEEQKNGFQPSELAEAIEFCEQNGLSKKLCGLMTLPTPLQDVGEAAIRSEFKLLRELRDRYLPGKLLNMGTSGDFRIAIEEGADWIRLGTILFGEREVS